MCAIAVAGQDPYYHYVKDVVYKRNEKREYVYLYIFKRIIWIQPFQSNVLATWLYFCLV